MATIHTSLDALFLVGLLIVACALVGAIVVAVRTHDWLIPLVLCGVAIVTALICF